MQYKEFVRQVQEIAGLDSREQAEKATRIALETLGERITTVEKDHMATQLPAELKNFLAGVEQTGRFSLEEYYNLVGSRSGVTYPHAVKQSRAVMQVLSRAIAPGELDDIESQLPPEYKELFGEEPENPVSPSSMTTREEKLLKEQELEHFEAQGKGNRGQPRQRM